VGRGWGQNSRASAGQRCCANFVEISKGMGLITGSCAMLRAHWHISMRDRIRERLTEYRAEALESIAGAENRTKADAAMRGILRSSMCYLRLNEDNKTGFAQYIDQSANFIRQLAAGSSSEYADELREAANKLKQDIIAKMDRQNLMQGAGVQLRNDLEAALNKLIKRKLEDFEWNIERKDMTGTTHNTVNIINSNISNSVMQITQSGKDANSKDTAQKLEEIINSEEIKGLPEETRLDVLDQTDDVIKELSAAVTDKGKVYRGLKRLGNFISSVASKSVADLVTQLAVAYAKAHGMM